MKLEDQVCSLELAKRLKELGVKYPAIFGWVHHEYLDKKKEWILIRATNDLKPLMWGGYDCGQNSQRDKEIAAYTASELGALLPHSIRWQEHNCYLTALFGKTDHGIAFTISYGYWQYANDDEEKLHPIGDQCFPGELMFGYNKYVGNEANVRAEALIYLIENEYIEVPK